VSHLEPEVLVSIPMPFELYAEFPSPASYVLVAIPQIVVLFVSTK